MLGLSPACNSWWLKQLVAQIHSATYLLYLLDIYQRWQHFYSIMDKGPASFVWSTRDVISSIPCQYVIGALDFATCSQCHVPVIFCQLMLIHCQNLPCITNIPDSYTKPIPLYSTPSVPPNEFHLSSAIIGRISLYLHFINNEKLHQKCCNRNITCFIWWAERTMNTSEWLGKDI